MSDDVKIEFEGLTYSINKGFSGIEFNDDGSLKSITFPASPTFNAEDIFDGRYKGYSIGVKDANAIDIDDEIEFLGLSLDDE